MIRGKSDSSYALVPVTYMINQVGPDGWDAESGATKVLFALCHYYIVTHCFVLIQYWAVFRKDSSQHRSAPRDSDNRVSIDPH